MDISKYPLERVFHLAAGVIPGAVALLIFGVSHPSAFDAFFGSVFLGYRTKLAIVLAVALVIGNTMTAFLQFLVRIVSRGVGTVLGTRLYRPARPDEAAPWRNETWRALLRRQIGVATPRDTQPMSQREYDVQLLVIQLRPESEREAARVALQNQRVDRISDDVEWQRWYERYQDIVLQQSDDDFESYVRTGLRSNLQATALYILLSSAVVCQVRHWWWILPACVWVLLLIDEIYGLFRQLMNRWSMFDRVVMLLSRSSPTTESGHSTSETE